MTATRRLRRLALAAVALCLPLLAACGDDPEPAAAADDEPVASGFPVTVEHRFGETTIEEAPRRVVTVGFTDHDPVLALGVVPVGLTDWYGDQPDGVWPWAHDALGDATPTRLAGELNVEAVAALDPDLIIGIYLAMDDATYELLSEVAPTIAAPEGFVDFGTPWQETTRQIGKALGRVARAEELIDGVGDAVAEARAEHPEFEGLELVYAGAYGEGQVYVEASRSARLELLTGLGFDVPDDIDALVPADRFTADVSGEQLELLDRDVLLWELGAAEGMREVVESNPLYRNLAVAREGRAVFVDDLILAGALAHASVSSLPYVLDELVPLLASAVS